LHEIFYYIFQYCITNANNQQILKYWNRVEVVFCLVKCHGILSSSKPSTTDRLHNVLFLFSQNEKRNVLIYRIENQIVLLFI